MNSTKQIKPSKCFKIEKCKELGITRYTQKCLIEKCRELGIKKYTNKKLEQLETIALEQINKNFKNMTLENVITNNIEEHVITNNIEEHVITNNIEEHVITNNIDENVITNNIDENMSFENDLNAENDKCINEIKIMGNKWVDKLLEEKITYTKPGSILYLLYGEKPSEQSISIKFGRYGEFLSKELIKMNKTLELLDCGIQIINNKKKDVDLIFKNNKTNTIHYYELKGNIELDTEKLAATIEKCQEIQHHLKDKYQNYIIDCGILNWGVYNRSILTSGLSNIKSFEKNIKIIHMEEFLEMVNIIWNEEDYYSYFKSLGTKIRN
jgi:hypothetical protein